MEKIKPSFPSVHLIITVTFLGLSLLFCLSPFRDTRMLIGSILFGSVGLTMLWFIDYIFITIKISDNSLCCRGYFSIRKFKIKIEEIEGYEVHQKVDQINALHEEIQIITSTEKRRLVFPKIAYRDYDSIKAFCADLKFLGYKELRHGKLLGKLIPIIFLISGLLTGIVGLIKLLK